MSHPFRLALALLLLPLATEAATITVTSTADTELNDGACTLREAIIAANLNAPTGGCAAGTSGFDTIVFGIPGAGPHTITTLTQLPAIAEATFIDGLSQPGANCDAWPPTLRIELTRAAGAAQSGLTLATTSSGSTIRGMVINGYDLAEGDNFRAAIRVFSNNNQIGCNLIGTNIDGTQARPNLRGIDINSASGNLVGSDGSVTFPLRRNVISANAFGQISTRGLGPSNNRIAGNFIGTDVTGNVSLGGGTGVSINGNPTAARNNIVGYDGVGDPARMRNVISGLSGSGTAAVSMVVGAEENRVSGNWIGLGADGTTLLGNPGEGVSLGSNASVQRNLVGWDGAAPFEPSGNVIVGNRIGVDVNGINGTDNQAIVGNLIGIAPDGTVMGNTLGGIQMSYGADALVAANHIAGNPYAIRLFASGSGRVNGVFLNNVATLPGGTVLSSVENCITGNAQGVITAVSSGATEVPSTFEQNWWGTPAGPNQPGSDTASVSVDADPFKITRGQGCSRLFLFSDGFEPSA